MPLAARSLALWGELADLLGEDVEFRARGHLRLAFDADGVADMTAFAAAADPHGLGIEIMTANELFDRFPFAGREAIAGSSTHTFPPYAARTLPLPAEWVAASAAPGVAPLHRRRNPTGKGHPQKPDTGRNR